VNAHVTPLSAKTDGTPRGLVLVPALDGSSPAAILPNEVGDSILAAFDPGRISRHSAISVLTTLYGPLNDVTEAHADIVARIPRPTAPLPHPTPCPVWCKDRERPAGHDFGPTHSDHWGHDYYLTLPSEFADNQFARVALVRLDEDDETGETLLSVEGCRDFELTREQVPVLLANLRAFTAVVEGMYAQMGGDR
jgi:hypothetical protein